MKDDMGVCANEVDGRSGLLMSNDPGLECMDDGYVKLDQSI